MVAGQGLSRRALLRDVVYLGGGALVLSACTGGSSDGGSGGSSGLPAIEGGEVVTDPSRFPTSFSESPEFAKQVAAGKLQPVAERIGQDPLVIQPVHGIGEYGGELRRAFQGAEDLQNGNLFCGGPDTLLYSDYRRENLVPNIARDWEVSADFTEVTVYLRRGMRWSDGQPFTADDIIFWRNDINLNESVVPTPAPELQIRGREVVVQKIDDFTVVYRSPLPYPSLPAFLAYKSGGTTNGFSGGGHYAPKHYLSQFHPAYTSEEEANRLATDAGFDSWGLYLLDRNSWFLNTEMPTLTPWVCTRPINNPPWEFGANPYSIWVDTDGNQLPYIPTITMSDTPDTQVIALGAAAGEYDVIDRGLAVDSLPVLLKNQDRSDYTIHQAPSEGMDATVMLNLAYDTDPEYGELIRTVEFRRALSLGLDRHQINQTHFLGSSTPSATMASDNSPYFPGSEWRTKWATHDPAEANQLLDQLGLTARDDDGFRMLPSGSDRIRLDIQSAASKVNYPPVGETVRQQWQKIGIDATNAPVDGLLYAERVAANQLMVSINAVITEDPFLQTSGLLTVAPSGSGLIGVPYVEWFLSSGAAGTKPPDAVKQLITAGELYQQGLEAPEDERIKLGQEIFKLHADQVWSIGLVGFGLALYGLYYANNDLGNVPARILNSTVLRTPSNMLPMTLYYQ